MTTFDLIIKGALAVILSGMAVFTAVITAAIVCAVIRDWRERRKKK